MALRNMFSSYVTLPNPKKSLPDLELEYDLEVQLQLAQALKRIRPVYCKTKDPGLLKLVQDVEAKLKHASEKLLGLDFP